MIRNLSPALLLFILASTAAASSLEYRISSARTGKPGINFSIGYTLGTHKGQAAAATGKASIDLDSSALSQAQFQVAISSMSTGNPKRDCHMVEALGLDYERSRYPEAGHLCDANQRLPENGPDSVAYPEIRFELQGLNTPDGSALGRIERGVETPIVTVAQWSIHGVTQTRMIPMTALIDTGERPRIRVRGQFEVLLKDHGIEVISWGGVISVRDRAKVELDLELEAL
jgi:polyisoprenoid-binding protein YceI